MAMIKTRILLISDTHCAPLVNGRGRDPVPPFKAPLPKADLLIHSGDLTYDGHMDQYNTTLDMLQNIDAPVKLVIAGNHDLSLDQEFVFAHLEGQRLTKAQAEAKVRAARELWTHPDGRAVKEGITFLDEGLHSISLPNGAVLEVYASPFTPEFQNWGFPYLRHEDRFNPPSESFSDAHNIASHPVPSFPGSHRPIDVMITHGPPYGRLDRTDRGVLAGCPHLSRAVMRARPLLHVFGHIHEGHGAERVAWSDGVDRVTTATRSMAEWQDGAWRAGVVDQGNGISAIQLDGHATLERHGAFVDVSESSGKGLKRGKETLLVNAAIMDVQYKPVNAPWVVDMDLPKAT